MTEAPAPVKPVAIQPIPPSIVMAIAAVMSAMEAVKKSNKNTHGGYSFASTDDIYAAITKKMGEIGFVVLALEEVAPEIKTLKSKDGKDVQWMKMSYLFVLATKDATWSDPHCRRSLVLPVSGPQSFQAAQSYAEKSFLRSLFKIPTGDLDLDSMPDGFDFNSLHFGAPKAPPPAPAAAGELLEQPAEARAPDMREVMKNVEIAMSKASDGEALNMLVEIFNAKYDGHIDRQIKVDMDAIYDANVARLTKKK